MYSCAAEVVSVADGPQWAPFVAASFGDAADVDATYDAVGFDLAVVGFDFVAVLRAAADEANADGIVAYAAEDVAP